MKKVILHTFKSHPKRNYHVIFMIVACLLYNTGITADNKKMTFTTLDGANVQKISANVMRDAYRRLDISVEIKELPARRSIAMANTGAVDGELSRVSGLEKNFTSLIPVKVPVNFIEGMVLSKDKPIKVNGWDSIKGLKIAIRRGVVFSERGTKGMDVQVLNSWNSIISALQTGRADVVVVPRTIATQILKKYQSLNIITNEPPIISLPLFHYLHKKHSSMVPRLEKVLKKMQAEGAIMNIIEKSRKELASATSK